MQGLEPRFNPEDAEVVPTGMIDGGPTSVWAGSHADDTEVVPPGIEGWPTSV